MKYMKCPVLTDYPLPIIKPINQCTQYMFMCTIDHVDHQRETVYTHVHVRVGLWFKSEHVLKITRCAYIEECKHVYKQILLCLYLGLSRRWYWAYM